MKLEIGQTYTLKKAIHFENIGRQVVLVGLVVRDYEITAHIRAAAGPCLRNQLGNGIGYTNALNLAPANSNCCCRCCNY